MDTTDNVDGYSSIAHLARIRAEQERKEYEYRKEFRRGAQMSMMRIVKRYYNECNSKMDKINSMIQGGYFKSNRLKKYIRKRAARADKIYTKGVKKYMARAIDLYNKDENKLSEDELNSLVFWLHFNGDETNDFIRGMY